MENNKTTLRKVSENSWTNGNLNVYYWYWAKEKWTARWTDFMNGRHEFRAETKAELVSMLRPYGVHSLNLGRKKAI